MLKAVVFDLGGTLLQYESATADLLELNRRGFASLYRHLWANGKVQLSETTFMETVVSRARADWRAAETSLRGMKLEVSLKTVLEDWGVSMSEAEWLEAKRAFFEPIQCAVTPRPGARYTLQALKDRGMILGLLSNTSWGGDIHDADLARFDLLDLLPIRLYSCDIGWLKPHPAAFRVALAALRVQPNEAVYVGDRLRLDIEPARQIGLWGVLIKTPYRLEQSKDIMPDAVIGELPELVKVLERRR